MASTSLIPGPATAVVAHAAADTSVINSTTETALATLAIPTTVAPGDVLEFIAGGDLLNNSGAAVNYIFRLKIGATTALLSTTQSVSASTGRRTWNARVEIIVGATNAEYVFGRIHITTVTANTWQGASFGNEGYGTATEDLTAGKNVQLTAQLGTAAATVDMVLHACALIHSRRVY